MLSYKTFGRRPAAFIGAFVLASGIALGACGKVTETLLDVEDPDLIMQPSVNSLEGALALQRGALDRFRNITGGNESTWLFGGLLADEWSTSSTFVQNDETDLRQIKFDNSTVTGMLRDLGRVRTAAKQALAALKEFAPTNTAAAAEMYFARGFAEMQLASDFCNGIPLSDATTNPITYGKPLSVQEVFTVALASLDTALAVNTGTDALSLSIRNATRVTRGRVLLGLGRHAEAGAAVSAAPAIPTSFSYDHTFVTASGDNIIWSQPASSRRYTVGDSLEGNARNLLVKNAIPFFSSRDPRLPVNYTTSNGGKDTTKSQDGLTYSRTTTLYGRSSNLPVANGIDARLIEAEAALKAGNPTGMLAILNALRAAPPKLGEVQPTVLPPLTLPATEAAQVDLLFREKAFWTFSRGQRLGDLRRLIRQYGRTPETTFPVGVHYRGGNYGSDVNLPVVQDEQNNPNFTQCTNRSA
jgi:hypothetical protein